MKSLAELAADALPNPYQRREAQRFARGAGIGALHNVIALGEMENASTFKVRVPAARAFPYPPAGIVLVPGSIEFAELMAKHTGCAEGELRVSGVSTNGFTMRGDSLVMPELWMTQTIKWPDVRAALDMAEPADRAEIIAYLIQPPLSAPLADE